MRAETPYVKNITNVTVGRFERSIYSFLAIDHRSLEVFSSATGVILFSNGPTRI